MQGKHRSSHSLKHIKHNDNKLPALTDRVAAYERAADRMVSVLCVPLA